MWGGDYHCLPLRPAILPTGSTHTICTWSPSLGGGYTAFSPSKTELSHFLGRLSHLLCQEMTALVKLRVSCWISKRGQDHSSPCQDLHIYTFTEHHHHVCRYQTQRPSPSWLLLYRKFPLSLGRRARVYTPSPLACSPYQRKTTFHRSIQVQWQIRPDRTTASTKPIRCFLSRRLIVYLFLLC